MKNGQIIIDKKYEPNYYCDWYIKSENGKSFLLAFNNDELDKKTTNQFVIRIFEMNENSVGTNQLLSDQNTDFIHGDSEEKRKDESQVRNSFIPKFEYTPDSSIKNVIIDSPFIKIQ